LPNSSFFFFFLLPPVCFFSFLSPLRPGGYERDRECDSFFSFLPPFLLLKSAALYTVPRNAPSRARGLPFLPFPFLFSPYPHAKNFGPAAYSPWRVPPFPPSFPASLTKNCSGMALFISFSPSFFLPFPFPPLSYRTDSPTSLKLPCAQALSSFSFPSFPVVATTIT